MPFSPAKTVHDPSAPLAWRTTVVVLALEKLHRGRQLSDDEKSAIGEVAERLDLLSEASQIRFTDPIHSDPEILPAHLQESFFTLVSIASRRYGSSKLPEFGQAGKDLAMIKDHVAASSQLAGLDPAILGRAKGACVDLLEHLNDQRPLAVLR